MGRDWLAYLALVAGGVGGVGEARAAEKKGPILTVSAEHMSYTRGLGTKSMIGASAQVGLGSRTMLSLRLAAGERRYLKESFRGESLSATLRHELGAGVSSRTTLAGGKAGPLFSRFSVGEELSWNGGETELRAGGRLTRFGDGIDVRSFHAGAGRKLGSVTLDYSVSHYARAGSMPRGFIQRLEGGLEDRWGRTTAQFGHGTSLHEHDWRPSKIAGSFTSAGLKRKQDIGRGLAVELGGSWTAFERPGGRYGGGKVSAGLTVKR